MSQSVNLNRRKLFKMGLGATGAIVAVSPVMKVFASTCGGRTPPQPEGPFYPVDRQLDEDNDLTVVEGRVGQKPEGQIIYVQGQVVDAQCRPVEGAVVEIWQACASGRYNHPGDRENPAPLDPNFQYWGRDLTDKDGKYLFKSILPGSYPAGAGWIRPPHIHFKVHKLGFKELTTQMYFEGNPYNADDRILRSLPRQEQRKVVVAMNPVGEGFEPGAKLCSFEIQVEKV